MTKMTRLLLAGVLGGALVACGGGTAATDHDEHHDEGHSGGEDLAAFEGPIGSSDVAKGGEVYATFCAGCHEGGAVGPELQGRTDSLAEIRHIIRNGEDRMPAFGADRISDDDMEAVLAYLQSNFGMFQ